MAPKVCENVAVCNPVQGGETVPWMEPLQPQKAVNFTKLTKLYKTYKTCNSPLT